MANALPALNPLWRNSLRTWLAATLAIGVMLWSGRGSVMVLALAMAVVFINENDATPAQSIGQMVGAALVGILTAVVLHQFSTAWPMLALALLVTGALVRGLGLLKGLGMGYMGCWSLEVIGYGKHFNWALIFDLAFAVVVGIGMAQLATWAFWPRRPLQQLPALEAGLCAQLRGQIQAMQGWLEQGDEPPEPLQSKQLLPRILLLQQLRDQRQGTPTPTAVRRLSGRLAQSGGIWRQLLRQWLLLEPLLLQLPAPLPADGLLQAGLSGLEQRLDPDATTPAPALQPSAPSASAWIQEARRLQAPAPLLLAIGEQLEQLQRLLASRALVHAAIGQLHSGRR